MIETRAYLIDYCRDINIVSWEYQNLSGTDRIQITNLSFECSIDFEDRFSNYNMIIIAGSVQVKTLTNILENNYINHFCKDITDDLIKNRTSITDIVRIEGVENKETYNIFKEKSERWMLRNLDLDIVLDLISERGMNKLREVDIKFLKNYGK